MSEEEIEEMKSRVDKLTCGMTEEETDALYNKILKLPKFERPISATAQCEINVNDLFDTIRAFRKIPEYNELIKDNYKKQQEIERLNNIINELALLFDDYMSFVEVLEKYNYKLKGDDK